MIESGAGVPRQHVGFWNALAFACELALVAAFAVAGWQVTSSVLPQVALAVGLPLVAAGVWALWMAPNSARRLGQPARLIAEVGLFVVSGAALAMVGHAGWGALVAAAGTVDFMVLAWRELPRRPASTQRPG